MKWTFFYHSLVSDWNHGNAHFLRGVVSELLTRGHQVRVFEPANGWSYSNLVSDHGTEPLDDFHKAYPRLETHRYSQDDLDLEAVAADSDAVIVHEWNEPWLVNGLGDIHQRYARNGGGNFLLLFHDTHHRAVSEPAWIKRFQLDSYDGVLAFGEVLSQVYREHGWSDYVWTWHEAADTRVFYPRVASEDYPKGDLVWIGNWGDDERTRELDAFLFRPVRELQLQCNLHGVRYPKAVLERLRRDGIHYHGWLPNFKAPQLFANHKVTVHVPRRYYAETLPGIPTIRPFEAMACGIPLVSAPWRDSEHLFKPGRDFLVAHNSEEMQQHLHNILRDADYAAELTDHALETIRQRHTCAHRVDQLLDIVQSLNPQLANDAHQDSPHTDNHSNVTGGSLHAYI